MFEVQVPLLVILTTIIAFSDANCGYKNCPETKEGYINVHLVPHSHDDVGWLKTVDQYYYGSRRDITPVGVQYILDSVVPELMKDPKKRFIYVEMAFFQRWWREQHDIMRHHVRRLVENGQLEFILGGWCMNDEAAAHYNAIIDQMTWGLKFINDTFGECARPTVAWQIDPFGHAKEQASLFAQMGFDGLFFGRLDYEDKSNRLKHKNMETMWKGSDSLGKSSWLLTGALFNGYNPPNGFCFDVYCSDEPIMDDRRLHDYNVDERVDDFIDAVKDQAQYYNTNNIIMTMGSDFNYVFAGNWYTNLDKLIKHTNARQKQGSKINLIYSTPSCYLKSLHESGKTYTSKTDDYFPYASDPHAYWTGYFTSRPALKGMIRAGNNLLQICKQLGALTDRDWVPGPNGEVTVLREAMGVLQHHDAVTGTAKQAVTFDYAQRLAEGFHNCEQVIDFAMKNLSTKHSQANVKLDIQFCNLVNISQCDVTEGSTQFVVTLYNPLVRQVTKYVRVPVTATSFEVLDPNGQSVPAQVVPIPQSVKNIPGRRSEANFELVFKATLPKMGFVSYYIKTVSEDQNPQQKSSVLSILGKKVKMGNSKLSLNIDRQGQITSVVRNGQNINFTQAFGFYEGHAGHNQGFDDRASGAYIFRPSKQIPQMFKPDNHSTLITGQLVDELHQTFSPYISQVVRIYRDSEEIEFDWIVGPIPVDDDIGKEVIARFSTDLDTHKTFYTDSNGRQILERVRNHRPTWDLTLTEPVSSNYYPVNTRMFVKDMARGSQMTVLTDRSQGGTSMNDGEIELMVHRRLLYDDAFGVGEALNEMAFGEGLVIRGKHWVQISPNGKYLPNRKHRFKAQQAFMDAGVNFVNTDMKFDEFKQHYAMQYTALGSVDLPENVHLLTLEEWHGNSRDAVLIRFEHMFDANEDPLLSRPVSFKLSGILKDFKISQVEEVILSANLQKEKLHRLQWNVEEDNDINQDDFETISLTGVDPEDIVVTLRPMQIRSFIVNIDPK